MGTLTKNLDAPSLIASQSLAASAVVRATADLRTADGAFLTIKITNGATGPNPACTCTISVAPTAGSTPAAAAVGTDWKFLQSFLGSTVAGAVIERSLEISEKIAHVCVEFSGQNQTVTVEAQITRLTGKTYTP